MSRILNARLLLLFFVLILEGCNDVHPSDEEFMKGLLDLEKKYYLKECLVKLNFLWSSEMDESARENVLHKIRGPIMEATLSGEFPYFSGHTTYEMKYYVFYFMDRCENRREYVQRLVEEKFLPVIPDFPRYEIEHEGIKPGFDGVTPTCCWLDY